tara:strand:+ start:424 stop:1188 length:765 start_codon:yes stop_codon:yes gene_type:complete
MLQKPLCLKTDHFVNQGVVTSFAKGLDGIVKNINNFSDHSQPIATYGILRGTGEILKKSRNFFYIDHGYFDSSAREFLGKTYLPELNGYFRVVYNDFYHAGIGSCKSDRFDKFNIEIKPMRKNGEYIILSEPSKDIYRFFNLGDWVNNTIKEIEKYSDRKILIHNKHSPTPLEKLLEKAWAFVSAQSMAGLKAMIAGVPAHYTNKTLKKINSLEEIESGKINHNIFSNLAYGQWLRKEMESGEAWEFIKQNLIV